MSPLLMRAVTAITAALIFYTIGVWWEHRAKVLKPVHLIFFWLGLAMDMTGTHAMTLIARNSGGGLTGAHGITGVIAIVLMLIHAVWATAVLVRKNEDAARTFHRFSLAVWGIWLIPFVIGMIMGMN
ncbi:MAG: TIGR03987 family protein [Mogibacterium sp.]|nr:TIGR03987 family protein [Mogibacterium sp.]